MNVFYQEVKAYASSPPDNTSSIDKAAQLTSASGGIKIILSLYATITTSKSITDSSQSQAIATADRDAGHVHFFSAPQFLVELRFAVLPDVRQLWDSSFVEKASTSITKCLIEILSTILEGTDEAGAFTRTAKLPPRRKATQKTYSIGPEKLQYMINKGFTKDLASEALYRCMSDQTMALDYCRHKWLRPLSLPIPDYDKEKSRRSADSTRTGGDFGLASEAGPAAQSNTSEAPNEPADQDTSDAADGLFLLARGGHEASNTSHDPIVELEAAGSGEPLPGLTPPPPAPSAPENEEATADGTNMSIDHLESTLDFAPQTVARAQQALESHLSRSLGSALVQTMPRLRSMPPRNNLKSLLTTSMMTATRSKPTSLSAFWMC